MLVPFVAGCSGRLQAAGAAALDDDASKPAGAERASDVAPNLAAAEAHPPVVEFKQPFPSREELFQPPEPAETAKPVQASKDENVQLRGFANADGLHVLLAIDGRLTALRVGQSRDDVEVLSIKPPSVVLRRGDRRWVESLRAEQRGNNSESAGRAAQ